MILVRYVFQAKWGRAGQVAEEFRQNEDLVRRVFGPDVRMRLLTDLSGQFDTVVQEMEFESLAAWEQGRAAIFSNPEFQKMQQAMGENPYESGRAELYTIEASF